MSNYIPGVGIIGAGTNPYKYHEHGQYQAQAYDTSMFGDYSNFNSISPVSAYLKHSIFGIGQAPQGMSQGAYAERMAELSGRFSSYALPSTVASATSVLTSLGLLFPGIITAGQAGWHMATGNQAALDAIVSAAAQTNQSLTNPTAMQALSSRLGVSGINYGSGLTGKLLGGMQLMSNLAAAPFTLAADAFSSSFAQPFMANTAQGLISSLDNIGRHAGINSMGTGFAEGSARFLSKLPFVGDSFTKGIAGAAGETTAARAAAYVGGGLLTAPLRIGGMFASFMATQAILEGTLHAGLNAAVGVDVKQDEIADTFEGLSSRVLNAGSNTSSKRFAKDLAQEIRDQSFADYKTSGVMGTIGKYLGFRGDSISGRFFGGWNVMEEMDRKTAHYALMSESGLISKSNSVDEFIKKADSMYAAIAKLGDALGQTTTKAMETARVLKSQGLGSPLDITNAANTISTTAAMTGYSSNQVLALTSEVTEAFRGTMFGSNTAMNIANDAARRISFASNTIGDAANENLLYTLRGKDSAAILLAKANAHITNSPETKQLLVASMYERTNNGGFRFTGKVNWDALNAATSGNSTFINDADTVARLNTAFNDMSGPRRREYELTLTNELKNMSETQRGDIFHNIAVMRGYGNDSENRTRAMDNYFRSQGLDPVTAANLAKVATADNMAYQAQLHEYFDQGMRRLDKIRGDGDEDKYATVLGKIGLPTHKLFGRQSMAAEMGFGALIGVGAAAAAGVAAGPMMLAGLAAATLTGGASAYLSDHYGAGDLAANAMLGTAMAYSGKALLTGGIAGRAAYEISTKAGAIQMGAQAPGLLLRAGTVASGLAAVTAGGYAGGYLGEAAYNSYFKDTMSENKAKAAGIGVGGVAGSAAGLVTAKALVGIGIASFTPVGWAAVAIASAAAGAYSVYDKLYGKQDITAIDRENLRLQMEALQGAERLRGVDLRSYSELMSSDNIMSEQAAKASASLHAYDGLVRPSDRKFAEDAAAKINNAYYSNTKGATHGLLTVFQHKDAVRNIFKNSRLEAGSFEHRGLLRLREIYKNLQGDVKTQFMTELMSAGLDSIKIASDGNVVTGKSLFSDDVPGDSKFSPANMANYISSANKMLVDNNIIGQGHNIINAGNAASVYAAINLYQNKDFNGIKRLLNAEPTLRPLLERMADKDKAGALANIDLNALKIEAGNIAKAGRHKLAASVADNYDRIKGVMLGDDASLIKQYIQGSMDTGDPNLSAEQKARLSQMAGENFESVADAATKTYLKDTHAMNVLFNTLKGNADPESINRIVKGSDLPSYTKDILAKTIDSYGPNATNKMGEIQKSMGRMLTEMHLPEMQKATNEAREAIRDRVYEKLDATLNKLADVLKLPKPSDPSDNNQPVSPPQPTPVDRNTYQSFGN